MMATTKNLVRLALMSVVTAATFSFTACSNEDDVMTAPQAPQTSQSATLRNAKTVLVYMAGKNNLSDDLNADLNEILDGSRRLGENDNLLVFVRRYDVSNEEPWLARVKDGQIIDRKSLSQLGITSSDGQNRASDPAVMEGVMHYAYSHYPANDGNYGLVLWGHSTGWLMMQEVNRAISRGFGSDYGDDPNVKDRRWINIPTLAKVLKGMPHLKFILGDCCNLMCLENLYELRTTCDYIIGSPAEIPAEGAPYDQILPDFFADGQFYTRIIDKYYASAGRALPLSAVKTSEMDHMAQVTRQALQTISNKLGSQHADLKGLIHYNNMADTDDFSPAYNMFYDAGDFIRTYASQETYEQWRSALDQAIVDNRMAISWRTEKDWQMFYADFKVTREKYHGVSMFVPQDASLGNYAKYNEDIKQTAWYAAVQ